MTRSTHTILHSSTIPWLCCGLLLVVSNSAAPASTLRARVIDARDIVTAAASTSDDGVQFRSEDGHPLTLRIHPDATQILNPNFDGRLYPVPVAAVEAALADLQPLPGRPLEVVVYCLPGLPVEVGASHAVGREIFLAPTLAPAPPQVLAYTVVHEIGHVVEHTRIGSRSGTAWRTYRQLRGLDATRFHDQAVHRDRPAEIFAEDFRMLYGGVASTYSGSHENPDLIEPNAVAGLGSYFEGVLEGLYQGGRLPVLVSNHPNPFNPSTTIEVRLRPEQARIGGTAQVEIHDLRGRHVRVLAPRPVAEVLSFTWDGVDESGSLAASGRYLYRVRLRDGVVAGSMTLLK